MQRVKLSKKVIDAATTNDGDLILWDSEVVGFGLRVREGGSKTFIAQYRAGGGRRGITRRFTIGRYGVLTVDDARLEARKVLLAAIQGNDPATKRRAKRNERTLQDVLDDFAKTGTEHLREGGRRRMLARLQHHAVPLLGRRPLSDIRVSDIEQFGRDVKAGKTAKNEKGGPHARISVRGGEGAAARVVRDLSVVFSYAIRQEWTNYNPCTIAKKPPEKRRTRFLTRDEMQSLGNAWSTMEANGANPKAIAIMRLWALTGCRRNEIICLKWSEVDFERACLVLADTKTGRSVRPLAQSAIAILKQQTRLDGSPYVFPSDEKADVVYQGTKRYWYKAVTLAHLPGVTPHTLRHTIGSAAVSTGETLVMTGAILGHQNQQSTSIYAHMQQDPARRAADRVVAPIATALGLNREANVVPIRSRQQIRP
jgi:integrase